MRAATIDTTETMITPDSAPSNSREQLKIVIVGHVDHGKSTLVGRLFHDTNSLPDGKFEQVQASCKRRGMQFEWSFLMDALQAERDQEITIDTSQIWFKTDQRNYVIIDAPGHKEFLKNMISGAASSEAALLLIDAKEGVQEQSKRHGYLLHLLGVEQITVVVNKMDLVDYSEERFNEVVTEYREYLNGIGVNPGEFIPISAREGENLARRSEHMDWYKGNTVIDALDAFQKKPATVELPLRFPIQDVYRFDEHKRIFAGRIESGVINVGDEVLFSPSNKATKIRSIESFGTDEAITTASAGMCIGVTLEEQLFIERGEVLSHVENAPVLTNLVRARLFWLGEQPLAAGKYYKMKLNTSTYRVEVRSIEQVISTDDLSHQTVKVVKKNDVAEVVLRIRGLASVDEFISNAKTGRFMLIDQYAVVGGGIISMEGFSDQRIVRSDSHGHEAQSTQHVITEQNRAVSNHHLGGILWFSGKKGSGKRSLALALEKQLFNKGYQVFVLAEEDLRAGVANDAEDQDEILRRGAEVAALFAKAGMIVITTFVSPKSAQRRFARAALPEQFHCIGITASDDACKKRLSLISEPRPEIGEGDAYETPDNADICINNDTQSLEEAVSHIEYYIGKNFSVEGEIVEEDRAFDI